MRKSSALLAAFFLTAAVLIGGPAARCGAVSDTTRIDFESLAPDAVVCGPGHNSTAKATVAKGTAHGGVNSAKVTYAFTDAGYIEFQLAAPVVVGETTDPMDISLWVKGAGKGDFGSAGLRLLDSKGNVFQYAAPGLSDKFNGDGWALYTLKLDPKVYQTTWGPSTDKAIHLPLRFFGFGASRSDAVGASGTVLIDDIMVKTAGGTAASAVVPSLAVTADRPLLIVHPGDSVTYRAAYTSGAPGSGDSVRYRWRTHSFDGSLVDDSPVKVASGGAPPAPFTVRPAQPGYVFVTCDLLDATGGVLTEARSSLATVTVTGAPHVAEVPFLIGSNSHLGRYSEADEARLVDYMGLIGIGVDRDGGEFSEVEPTEGDWHWDRVDKRVALFKAAHIQLLYNLSFSTLWASTGNTHSGDWRDWAFAPPVTQKYVDYAKAAVTRYKSDVHYWEIWNEPDLTFWRGTADQYSTLLSAAVKGIHEADPAAKVMNGGVSEVAFRPHFIPDFLAKTSPEPDIFAYHSHGAVTNLPTARARVSAALDAQGMAKTPVWINEAGIWSIGDAAVHDQALVLAKRIASSMSLGDTAYLWYDLIDDGLDPTDSEHHFGLLFHDYSPKPSLVAMHTVINRLVGKAFSAKLSAEPDQTILAFRGAGETSAMLWSDGQGTTASALLRSKAPTATLTDLMGRSRTLKPFAGCYTVPVSYEPTFLTVSGEKTSLESIKPIIAAPSATMPEGEATPYLFKISNPLSVRLTGQLALSSRTIQMSAAHFAVSVAPGRAQTIRTSLTITPGSGASSVLSLHFVPSAGLPPIDRETRLRTAIALPYSDADDVPLHASPTVSLDPARNGVALFQATPMDTLKLHGPTDLSAKVWMWQSAAGLRVHLTVTDDIHFQNELPGSYWKGDNVQFALVGSSEQMLEWSVALPADGPKIERSLWPADRAAQPLLETANVTRVGTTTTYDITLPRTLPEIADALRLGCRVSLLVNDNDGAGRKGWVEWTPGIGMTKDPSAFVPVAFRHP